MKFLVSYKVVKRCIQTDDIVENIDSLVLDTRSTPEHSIEFENVVDEKVLMMWADRICKKERVDYEFEFTFTILKYSILSFCKLGTY